MLYHRHYISYIYCIRLSAENSQIQGQNFEYQWKYNMKYNAYVLKTPRVVSVQSYSSVAFLAPPSMKSHFIEMPIKSVFDLVTLTFDLDLWTWPKYPSHWPPCQKFSLSVCLFTGYSGNRLTHTHTHTLTHDVKITLKIPAHRWPIAEPPPWHNTDINPYQPLKWCPK